MSYGNCCLTSNIAECVEAVEFICNKYNWDDVVEMKVGCISDGEKTLLRNRLAKSYGMFRNCDDAHPSKQYISYLGIHC